MTELGPAEFSAATGLSAKALRLYEERGLLSPAFLDPATGYRRYATDQIAPATRIALMRRASISLGQIARFLEAPSLDTIDDWRGELQAETTQRQRALAALAHSLGLYTDQPKEPVAAITIRAIGSIAELTEVFDLLGAQFDPPIDHTDERRFGRLRSVFPQQRDLLLVAEAGQELIGGALGFLDDDAQVTLRILALAANHRRRGVGRSLLQAFENNAMALGATRVSLGADQEVGFYIRHGYQTMLLLQWVFNPDDHESEAKAVLTGPLSQAVHAHREFEGTKQLFIDLDDPNPALYMYAGDKAPGATVSFVMTRCLPHAPGTRISTSRTDR